MFFGKIKKSLFIICLFFALIFGLFGNYFLKEIPKARAATPFYFKTGYYLGTGTTLSITGLGFTPQVIIIKSDTAAGSAVWKSSAMSATEYAYWGSATANDMSNQITLDADGFTVRVAADVNTVNIRYTYIAFNGSDCVNSDATMCVGSYAGNGSATQNISTGFQPNLAWVKRTTAVAATFRTSEMPNGGLGYASYLSATADDATANFFPAASFYATGFTVGATNNSNGGLFYFVAFKKGAGVLEVGSYTGDGVGKTISPAGLSGVTPSFVLTKENFATSPCFNMTESWGDYSGLTTATANQTLSITKLQDSGFIVGTSAYANANGIGYQYFAFGPATATTMSGSFTMKVGYYTGDGVSPHTISDVGFAPDLVFIKSNTDTQWAVWSTSLDNNVTHYFASATAGIAAAITGMVSNGFTVGTHSTVNSLGTTYEYIAFGNATSPKTGGRAADFVIGAYTGNGIAGRPISNLGMAPNFVVTKTNSTDQTSLWSNSSLAAGTAGYFAGTADDTSATFFTSLDSTGFTIGSVNSVNRAGYLFHFFAFKTGAGTFSIGSYTGTGAQQDITKIAPAGDDIGFDPEYVFVKRTANSAGAHHSNSTQLSTNTLHFTNTAQFINGITAFVTGGFRVISDATVNFNTGSYRFAAWNASLPTTPPNTPSNPLPANASTGNNLNPTLSADYSDPNSLLQTNAQWEVDDASDFLTPVWTRTAGSAETSIVVNSTNGTFANSLAGKEELSHNTIYYWRVRYSNGIYSSWLATKNFTTNTIVTPTNSSPISGGTVTSLTPVLTALAFSDAQTGHTAASAEWQFSTSDSFTSPLYNSGTVAYGTSHAVPNATLSDRSSYYWRVRQQDSGGQWSEYSTATKFAVSESLISVTPIFGHIVVDQGDVVKIDAQVKLASGAVINDASVNIKIYDPAGAKIEDESMVYLPSSSGIYRYSYNVPEANGSYLYVVTAVSDSKTGYGAANFEVRTLNYDVSDIQGKVNTLSTNMDILIGAFISANSSVNDGAATTTSFITNLTNLTNNFYKNSVLTFTSGALSGQVRRISAYAGDTKTITVSPAFSFAPANANTFSIVKQNVYVEEQAENIQIDVTYIKGVVDDIYTLLGTVDGNLTSAQTTINQLRTSQQKFYRASITDASEIAAGSNYKVKLTLLDYESSPVDPPVAPTIKIYDAGDVEVKSDAMTKDSVGVYSYSYLIDADADIGLWETKITTTVGALPDQVLTDYFQVTGSPAEVRITGISDPAYVDNIKADIKITNEGTADDFDYRYEWCVVSAQSNACGDAGGADVDYGSGAKRILKGASWETSFYPAVSDIGDYWFKLVVYWGTESSEASQKFTAVVGSPGVTQPPSGGGGGQVISLDSLHQELLEIKGELKKSSADLISALDILGIKKPGDQSLLETSDQQLTNYKEIQNKLNELGAVSATIRQVVEQGSANPVVETYMKFNSVEINFLITNPASTAQTVKFKSFLPEEVKPENIMDSSGLKIDFDANANSYYVSADIELGPKESINKKVEIKDIWIFSEEEVNGIKKQAEDFANVLKGTQYDAQGAVFKGDIQSSLDILITRQKESYSSPQNHIVVYRENAIAIAKANENLSKLKDLVVQSGASNGLFGKIGGIQVFATWGIILAILFGFGCLIAVMLSMWKNQAMLAEKMLNKDNPEQTMATVIIKEDYKKIQISSIFLRFKNLFNIFQKFKKSIIWVSIFIISAGILVLLIIYFLPRLFGGEKIIIDSMNGKIIDSVQIPSPEASPASTAETSPTPEAKAEAIPETISSKIKVLKTSTGWLNVRKEDSLDAEIITKVYSGEEYIFSKERNEWYQIILKDDRKGWVNGVYVEKIK